MKKVLLPFLLVLIFGMVFTLPSMAQVRNVTFMVNTATVPDTLIPTSSVTITGSDTAITSWGDGVATTNIGGDYWSKTVGFGQGDTIAYKFRVNGAWESNSTNADGIGSISDNRTLIVGSSDTTLPVQFVNFTGISQNQYRTPWTAVADSFINIWFRINMQGRTTGFDKNLDTVGVRGDKKGGTFGSTYFGWAPTR